MLSQAVLNVEAKGKELRETASAQDEEVREAITSLPAL